MYVFLKYKNDKHVSYVHNTRKLVNFRIEYVSPALNMTSPQATEVPLFAGLNVHTISGCSFHIYRGPVTVQQNHETTGKSNNRRRLVIDSDVDD